MKNILFIAAFSCFIGNTIAQNFTYGWHATNTNSENHYPISNQVYNDTLYSFFSVQDEDSLDADPGTSEDWIISHDGSIVNTLYYFTKRTKDGTYISSHKLIETAQSYSDVRAIEISSTGQLIIVGYSYAIVSSYDLDFDPSPVTVGSYSRVTDGYLTFIAFYDLDGNYSERIEYAHSNTSSVYFTDMSINEQNELILVGELYGTVDMDFTAGNDSLSTSGIENDALVMKIDLTNEVYMWSKAFGNTFETGIYYVEAKNNEIYLMGYYSDAPLDLDPSSSGTWNVTNMNGSEAIFLSRWNANGGFITGMGIHGQANYDYVQIRGLAVDDQSNIYICGNTDQNMIVDLDPSINTKLVNTTKYENYFLAKYNMNFALLWSKNIQNDDNLYYTYQNSNIVLSENYLAMVLEVGSGIVSYSDQTVTDTLSNGSNYGFNVTAISPYYGTVYNTIHYEGDDVSYSYLSLNDFAIDSDENIHVFGDFMRFIDFNQIDFTTVYDTSFLYLAPNYYNTSPFNLMLSTQSFLTIDESNSIIDVSLYPNPTNGLITINSTEKVLKVSLVDLSGKLIELKTENTSTIDLTDLNSGYYLLKIETESGSIVKKIQKL